MENKKIVIVGGGAAGFFCAIHVAELHPEWEIQILEKSTKVLSKVRVSGGGRCNVTHACPDIEVLLKKYPRGARFLKKSFYQFATKNTIEWFSKNGVELHTEKDGRMFPTTNNSETIIDCFLRKIQQYKIQVLTQHEVIDIVSNTSHSQKFTIQLQGKPNMEVDAVCLATGGMFVQSEKFIAAHGGNIGDVSIYGQESNPTTWRLAAMNLAIRGIDYNLGREPGDTFTKNQHSDLRADFILANPPFNISDWWHGSLEGDPRWVYGTPPQGNANYAWLQHMIYHLKLNGRAGIVLANGSMSSSQNSEGEIRRAMVDADVVEVMIALPGQLFFNTQIPACLWFLAKQKTTRQGEVLFIDARKLGSMISRVQAELTDEVIERIAGMVAAWRSEEGASDYQDIAGYCRSVKLEEIAEHGHVLTPGRYVGAEEVEDDDEAFADKMQKLTEKLGEQMAKGAELDVLIRQKLGGLGYEL